MGESSLLLRYSDKDGRELNMGKFRIATGLGGLLAPIVGSIMYAMGEYRAIFCLMGVGYFVLSPIVYYKITNAKVEFFKLA